MRNLKIAFFGTSDRSISILDSLKQNFNLVLCLTKSDVTVINGNGESGNTQIIVE